MTGSKHGDLRVSCEPAWPIQVRAQRLVARDEQRYLTTGENLGVWLSRLWAFCAPVVVRFVILQDGQVRSGRYLLCSRELHL